MDRRKWNCIFTIRDPKSGFLEIITNVDADELDLFLHSVTNLGTDRLLHMQTLEHGGKCNRKMLARMLQMVLHCSTSTVSISSKSLGFRGHTVSQCSYD